MNPHDQRKAVVLIAEDDPDDRLLVEEALRPFNHLLHLWYVEDGEGLMEFLAGGTRDRKTAFPQPRLILLNINMPRKDGRQALMEIKQNAAFRDIPVVIWTTSAMEEEKRFCLETGAQEFVTKPHDFAGFESALRRILHRWIHLSPSEATGSARTSPPFDIASESSPRPKEFLT
jgi:CheY-like chemotaxis protein